MTGAIIRRRLASLFVLIAIFALTGCSKKADSETTSDSGFSVGYAVEGVTAVEDPNAMSKLLDEAYQKAEDGRIALEYKPIAISEDGVNFACYLANSVDNRYDMFIAIYGDTDFTDELYLSQLIRPGSAFQNISLEHPLDPGTHEVYVAFTTVETTESEQIIHGQTVMGMDFIVNS